MPKLTINSNLNEVIIEYLEYCEIEKNLTQSTIKMYHFYLMDFDAWAKDYLKKDKVTLEDITNDLIKKYRIFLNRRKSSKSNEEFKKTTQKTFLVALRAFLRYLVVVQELELLSPEQIILGKTEDRIPKVLNQDQIKDLFEVQNLNRRSGIRDRAILETLFSTGLRVSELISLNKDDVNLDSGEFSVIGKGRKARTVYLSPSAINWIKRYLATRSDHFMPLFLRYSGKKMDEGDYEGESLRLTARSVQRMVKKYIKRAGLSVDATPHTLRHSFATGLLREGADLRSVQELLGHSNVSTTQIYTHVTNLQLKKVHEKYHKDIDSESEGNLDLKEKIRETQSDKDKKDNKEIETLF